MVIGSIVEDMFAGNPEAVFLAQYGGIVFEGLSLIY